MIAFATPMAKDNRASSSHAHGARSYPDKKEERAGNDKKPDNPFRHPIRLERSKFAVQERDPVLPAAHGPTEALD